MDYIKDAQVVVGFVLLVLGFLGIKTYRQLFPKKKKTLDGKRFKIGRVLHDLKDKAAAMDPSEYRVLVCETPSGEKLTIPLFKDYWAFVYPGVMMMLMGSTDERTVCALRCAMAQELPRHRHEANEILHILDGSVDSMSEDSNVTKSRHAGDTWEIPGGEFHACVFRDATVNVTYEPPLPDGEEQILDLRDIDNILDKM